MEATREQREIFYQNLIENVNTSRGYVKYSGIQITKLENNYCEGELTITPDCCNYLGIVHGGCLAALGDTVAGLAACTQGRGVVTLNYGFSFLRQATGNKIKCVAEPEKIGNTISVFRCSLTDDQNKLVASGQFTFFMTGQLGIEGLAGVPKVTEMQ